MDQVQELSRVRAAGNPEGIANGVTIRRAGAAKQALPAGWRTLRATTDW